MNSFTPKQKNAFAPTLLILLAASMFSLSSVCAKKTMAYGISPYQVTFIRLALGLFCVFLLVIMGQSFRPQKKGSLLVRGVLSSFGVLTFFITVPKLPLGFATLLNYQAPLFTILFCVWFLKEPFRPKTIVALALSSVGIVLLSLGTFSHSHTTAPIALSRAAIFLYVILGILSAAFSGAGTATIKVLGKTEGPLEIFAAFCLIGTLLTLPPTLYLWVTPDKTQWLYLVAMSLTSVVGQLSLTYALRSLSAIYGSVLLQLSPVLTIVFSVLIFKEQFSNLSLLGTLLTFVGVGLVILQGPPKHLPQPATPKDS